MTKTRMTNDEDPKRKAKPRPLQFGLGTLLAVTAAAALLFGLLEWFKVPARISGLILLIAAASVVAAGGLVAAVAGYREDGDA